MIQGSHLVAKHILLRLCFAVYEDGKVCISILHPPGEDRFNEHVSVVLFLTQSWESYSSSYLASYHVAAVLQLRFCIQSVLPTVYSI